MESDLIGKWVAATYSYGGIAVYDGGANGNLVYGILESADDAALVIRQAGGDSLYLPLGTVRDLRAMHRPESEPEDTLLRPADSVLDPSLLRPSQSAAVPTSRLLRPDSDFTESTSK